METPALLLFVNTWVGELSTAIEMFNGRRPEIAYTQLDGPATPPADCLWAEQSFAMEGSLKAWIGAPEAVWNSLGKALGEESPEGIRSTYLETVGQAQQGTATVLGNRLGKTFHCEAPTIVDEATLANSSYDAFEIVLKDWELPSLFLAIDREATAQVIESERSTELHPFVEKPKAAEEIESPLLSDVMRLRLPVSISIGRGELEMRTALNAAPGSVMILPTNVDELADLVVHGKVVARGRIVATKGSYGLRITQVVSRQERMIASAESNPASR